MSDDREDKVRSTLDAAEEVSLAPGELADALPPDGPPDGPPPRTPESGEEPPAHPVARASEQPLNDYGNGQRYVIHCGEEVMFVPRVGWFIWEERYWQKDPLELGVRAKAQGIWRLIEQEVDFLRPTPREEKLLSEERELNQRLQELEQMKPEERGEDYSKDVGNVVGRLRAIDASLKDRKSLVGRRLTHAKNAGNTGPIDHMLQESQPDLAVDFEALDANPLEVNTESGLLRFSVVDMRDEGAGKTARVELVPHERGQLVTKMMPVRYDREARAPNFEAFLEKIQPQRSVREFILRWFGLSMTAAKVQKFAFFYGNGANGKSILMDTMGKIFGEYSASIKIESITGVKTRTGAEATPDLIPMLGARYVRTSEPEQGQRLNEGLIKQLTGGEPVPVRPNYGDQINMDAYFKLTMAGNHKPEIHGGDHGIWRRVLLVLFGVQIEEKDKIPEEELLAMLWEERDGIFQLLVDGLIDYLEGGLRVPEEVTRATAEYQAESDPIGNFLQRCCIVTGDDTDLIMTAELGAAFNFHLIEENMTQWKSTTFTKKLATISKSWRHPQTGNTFEKSKASVSQYIGLRFTDDFKRRWDNAPKDSSGRALAASSEGGE